MKCVSLMIAALALTAGVIHAEEPATKPSTQPTSSLRNASYGIGYTQLADIIRSSQVKLDHQSLLEGLHDALEGRASKVSDADVKAAMQQVMQELQANAANAAANAGADNVAAGNTYRAENGKKAGVTTTASGLQIETIKEGTGESPKATDTVKVHYTGTLIDGTKFDSSVDRGEPATFPLNGVIRGWTEGLQLMKVGGKSRLVLPPEIGYGARGAGPTIPPNATLVFEVELLEIVKK